MCGIAGYVGKKVAYPILLEILKRVEYRGYDSAGIASLNGRGIELSRETGELYRLEKMLARENPEGLLGIAHVRWATHGKASVENAHPHVAGEVAVVHNGIIENYQDLRCELTQQGAIFNSSTDTEVISQLINYYLHCGLDPIQATQKALGRLEGTYALGILFESERDFLLAARKGSPLVVGRGSGGSLISSDTLSLYGFADSLQFLEEGDLAVVTKNGITTYDSSFHVAGRRSIEVVGKQYPITKDGFPHFMLKEIHQQPATFEKTMQSLVSQSTGQITLPELPFGFRDIFGISVVACGTSSYAGLTGRNWLESLAGLRIDWRIASEFLDSYIPDPKWPILAISQSGETFDTLKAMKEPKRHGVGTVSIVNVPTSAMARLADATICTLAGPEIAVASTKAFTTQLAALGCFSIYAGRVRGKFDREQEKEYIESLLAVPEAIKQVIVLSDRIREIAKQITDVPGAFFLGRGASFPIALEGALKLKEISYIHAEGFPAGELKHGPLALISEWVPVVVLAPNDKHFKETVSNLQEVKARGGRILLLSDESGCERLKGDVWEFLPLPDCGILGNPIIYAVTLQLLAYHVSVLKGINPDKPRNLAKSVTVE